MIIVLNLNRIVMLVLSRHLLNECNIEFISRAAVTQPLISFPALEASTHSPLPCCSISAAGAKGFRFRSLGFYQLLAPFLKLEAGGLRKEKFKPLVSSIPHP